MKLYINPRIKNLLWVVLAIVVCVVALIWIFTTPTPDHIEDTNGADNYSLQTITEQDVVEQKMGSRGAVKETETHFDAGSHAISNGTKYSSEKFTGVYLLHTETILKGSDIYVSLAEYEIKEGNFAFYIVLDGEVISKILPEDDGGVAEFTLENIDKTGVLEYIIAGESANFSFVSSKDFE